MKCKVSPASSSLSYWTARRAEAVPRPASPASPGSLHLLFGFGVIFTAENGADLGFVI